MAAAILDHSKDASAHHSRYTDKQVDAIVQRALEAHEASLHDGEATTTPDTATSAPTTSTSSAATLTSTPTATPTAKVSTTVRVKPSPTTSPTTTPTTQAPTTTSTTAPTTLDTTNRVETTTTTTTSANNLVFLSTNKYSGLLNGESGADGLCTREASQLGYVGTFKAWVSEETGGVVYRFSQSSRSYVRPVRRRRR